MPCCSFLFNFWCSFDEQPRLFYRRWNVRYPAPGLQELHILCSWVRMLLDPFWGESEPECLVLQAFPTFGLFLWLRLLPAEELGQQGTADAGLRRCLALLGEGCLPSRSCKQLLHDVQVQVIGYDLRLALHHKAWSTACHMELCPSSSASTTRCLAATS